MTLPLFPSSRSFPSLHAIYSRLSSFLFCFCYVPLSICFYLTHWFIPACLCIASFPSGISLHSPFFHLPLHSFSLHFSFYLSNLLSFLCKQILLTDWIQHFFSLPFFPSNILLWLHHNSILTSVYYFICVIFKFIIYSFVSFFFVCFQYFEILSIIRNVQSPKWPGDQRFVQISDCLKGTIHSNSITLYSSRCWSLLFRLENSWLKTIFSN